MSGNDWVGSQGDAPPDGHQMPRPKRRQGELVEGDRDALAVIIATSIGATGPSVQTEADLCEPDQSDRDAADAILGSDWLQAHVDAEVVAALEGAAADYSRDAVGFKPSWGSNGTDCAVADFAVQSLNWLRDRAARVRAQIPTSGGGAV